jgi:glyoxylase-like metal-dependent hydrolase (beta-lactamase superfamily II)
MQIHHLDCGTLYPRWPRLNGVLYCLLVETNDGLVLVDTGFGLNDYAQPTGRMRLFTWLMGTPCDPEETAIRQVARLGFAAEDVRHIILTHLHLDHAGGLPDFPEAQVHILRAEYEAAMHPLGLIEHAYEPAQWAHGPRWVLHEDGDRQWYGFDCIPIVAGLLPEILMIPLPGHTRGHCGVAVATPQGWLFHCGDAASPFHRAADPHQVEDTRQPLNRLPDWIPLRLLGPHVPRLRALVRDRGGEVTVISAHDTDSLTRYQAGI